MADQSNQPIEPDENSSDANASSAPRFGLINRHLRYPIAYICLLFFSALDVILTWRIMHKGGSEANPIAELVIDYWGLDGMIMYKFALVTVFILICEGVGTLRDATGRSLSRISVLIALVPVVWSLFLLLNYSPE